MKAGAIHSVALAISRSQENPKQKHVAFLYKNTDQAWWLLHLGWHHVLHHTRWDSAYYWLPFQHLEPEVVDGLVDHAVIIGNRQANTKIPYSVVFQPGQYFDPAGDYIRHGSGEGLTCATFILAIFRRWELPLIEENTWPHGRQGDARWVLHIVQFLYKWSKKQEFTIPLAHFFEQLRQRWTLRRYRPEEICACAAVFRGTPLSFHDIDPVSNSILAQLP